MRTFFLFLVLVGLSFSSAHAAPKKLELKVLTSAEAAFSVNSTLILGQKDAILVDAQFTLSAAHRVAADLLESGRNLTHVYITHSHPDHYWGLQVIRYAFPDAKIVALPSTIADIKATWEKKLADWKPVLGKNVPEKPLLPEPLLENSLTLEGEKIEIVGEVQGDERNNSYLWIPSLRAVICGDIVYNGVYPWTVETNKAERGDWIKTLDRILALNPAVVIAGHKNPALEDSRASLSFMKEYLSFYDGALESSKTAAEFKQKIKAKFPNLKLEVILQIATDPLFPAAK